MIERTSPRFLWMLFLKAKGSEESIILFEVIFQMTEENRKHKIKAIIGPGDTPEPVLTSYILPDD
jgi:hypothetical protein